MTPDELMMQIMRRPYGAPEIVAIRIHPETWVDILRQDRRYLSHPGPRTFMGREIIEDRYAAEVELLDQKAVDELRKPPRPAIRRADLDNPERDAQTWEVEGGRFIIVPGPEARKHGAANILYQMGLGPNPKDMPRRPVYQDGVMIGTLPGDFDPYSVRSNSLLYEPRRGDFVETPTGLQAAASLCPGDLSAIVGFRPA